MGLVPMSPVISEAGTSVIPDLDKMTKWPASPRFTGAVESAARDTGAVAANAIDPPRKTAGSIGRQRSNTARRPALVIVLIANPPEWSCRHGPLERREATAPVPRRRMGNQLSVRLEWLGDTQGRAARHEKVWCPATMIKRSRNKGSRTAAARDILKGGCWCRR